MISPIFIVSFTGHRPKPSAGRTVEDLEACQPVVASAFRSFQEKAEASGACIEVLCSAAEGADLIACETVIGLDLPLHLILPLPCEQFSDDFKNSPDAWRVAEKVIAYCKKGMNGSSFRVARGSHVRNTCYAETNIQILDAADGLIALWDGVALPDPGGTSRMLQQALALELPIIQINSQTQDTESYHLHNFASASKTNTRSGIYNMNEISAKLNIKSNADIADVFTRLDEVALQSSRWYRRATTLSIFFHGIAALIAGFTVSFYAWLIETCGKPNGYLAISILAFVELCLVGSALWLMWQTGRKNTQYIWMRCRFAAELLRGILATGRALDPIYPRIMRHLPEWRRFALSCSLSAYRAANSSINFKQEKRDYLENRVNDQIKYFSAQYKKAAPKAKWCKRIAGVFSVLAIIVIAAALFSKATHTWELVFIDSESKHSSSPWLALLPIALPLIAGMATALLTALDFGRRAHRYHQMVELLIQTKKWIEQLDTPPTLCQAIARTEEILLDEQIEWLTTANSGSGH